jgi:hypothetical protein
MTEPRVHSGRPVGAFEIPHGCAEAQADGVPCPTLGRSCEICERALRLHESDAPLPSIRPVGCD